MLLTVPSAPTARAFGSGLPHATSLQPTASLSTHIHLNTYSLLDSPVSPVRPHSPRTGKQVGSSRWFDKLPVHHLFCKYYQNTENHHYLTRQDLSVPERRQVRCDDANCQISGPKQPHNSHDRPLASSSHAMLVYCVRKSWMRAGFLESGVYSRIVGRVVWIADISQWIRSKEEYGTNVH